MKYYVEQKDVNGKVIYSSNFCYMNYAANMFDMISEKIKGKNDGTYVVLRDDKNNIKVTRS